MKRQESTQESERAREWKIQKVEIERMVEDGTLADYTGNLKEEEKSDIELFMIALYLKETYKKTRDIKYKNLFYLVKDHWKSSDTSDRDFDVDLD